ncbi:MULTISPECIES: OmpA family protein [Helicobacter]|uniref:OmpA family protein n=1 Tax=Helicobacter TaxID=209 RepID=UPI00202B4A11|nr:MULTISPECIES: OmpA family protein [Helicobacter]MCI7047578.1 OmpA family protein [Helicobacter sp.]MCI7766104.1 OmpA family protein [Helicobacter sp.]MCL9821412.1 OmpA family protein [Helicobacter colisuis]MDY5616471.1 OmpA family protein [Helicobacter sp.]
MKKFFSLSLVLSSMLFAANNQFEITPQIGGSWHVDNQRMADDIDLSYGLKAGARVAPDVLLELGYDWITHAEQSIPNAKTSFNRYYMNLVKEFEVWQSVSPYILGGVGYEDVSNNSQSLDSAPFGQYGVGLRWEAFEYLHFKTELRHLMSFDGRSDVVAMLGFSIPFGTYGAQQVAVAEEAKEVVVEETQEPALSHIHTFNVEFPSDSAVVDPAYYPEIQDFAKYMEQNPEKTAIINGHTDSTGSAAYNQKLSEKRAVSVKNEIVKQGISAERLEAKGYGEEKPIASNKTREGRQKNRRVEAEVYLAN